MYFLMCISGILNPVSCCAVSLHSIFLRLGEVPEEIEWSPAVAKVGGVADGFGDEVLCAADGFDGRVAQDKKAEQRGGEGAAGSVGRGGIEVLAGEAVDFA